MLRLKINLRVRRSVRVKCPRHPRYNPEREGPGAICGGCRYCQTIYELYAGKLAVELSFAQASSFDIRTCVPLRPSSSELVNNLCGSKAA